MNQLLDHRLTARVAGNGYTQIAGRVVSFGESIDYGKFTEAIAWYAYKKTDLAHVVASIVYEGKRSVIAHVYTNDLSLIVTPHGLYFRIEVYMDLDFLVDSLAKGDVWEVGYTMLMGQDVWFEAAPDGKAERLICHVERLYDIIIRQPQDRRITEDYLKTNPAVPL